MLNVPAKLGVIWTRRDAMRSPPGVAKTTLRTVALGGKRRKSWQSTGGNWLASRHQDHVVPWKVCESTPAMRHARPSTSNDSADQANSSGRGSRKRAVARFGSGEIVSA